MTEEPCEYLLPHCQVRLAGIYYQREQPGLPLVALHGWLDNAKSFEPLARALGRPILALELPGHGHSGHAPLGRPYEWSDYLGALYEFFDEHWQGPFILVGHSLGAGVASLLAGLRPAEMKRLVLIEGFGTLIQDEADAPGQFLRFLAARKRSLKKERTLYPTPREAVAARANAGDLGEEASALMVARHLNQMPSGNWAFTYDPRLKWPSPVRMSRAQSDAFLGQIDVPCLLIGADDSVHFAKSGWIQERMHLVPQMRCVTLPSGGHHLHMTRPEEAAAVIRDFLDEKAAP